MSDIPERDIVLAYLAETNDPAFFMDGRTRALIRVAYDTGVASQQAVVRAAAHIADDTDTTDWQRGYRACAKRVFDALDGQ